MYPYGRASRRLPAAAARPKSRHAILETLLDRPAQFSVWALDGQFRYVYFNSTHATLMRAFWGAEIRLGAPVLGYLSDPEYRRLTLERYEEVAAGQSVAGENSLSDDHGRLRSFHTLLSPPGPHKGFPESGGIAAFSIETTTLRRHAEALAQAKADTQSLIHELDHRVKNNLQTVISILSLQQDIVSGSEAREVLRDTMNRVASLGFIYDASIISEHLSHIAFHAYLEKIVSYMGTHTASGATVEVEQEFEELHLPMRKAVPLGLMTLELLALYRKVAHLRGTHLHLRLSLTRESAYSGSLIFSVDDDGQSEFPQTGGVNPLVNAIIRALAEQIDAAVSMRPNTESALPEQVEVRFSNRG